MVRMYNCIDAGSRYCPCDLADTNNCISCSQLRGEILCDCNWNGICIFYEYQMENKKRSNFRKSYKGLVIEKTKLDKSLFLLKIQLDTELLKELEKVGSYVFIKKAGFINYYEMPMSIFDIDEENIYIVYQEIGPKTKNIQDGEELSVRGAYWNGIIGDHKLSDIENSNILIITRGMGQSSILLPLKNLMKKGNKVVLFLDKGKLNSSYCRKYILDKNVRIENLDLFSRQGKEKLREYIENNLIDVIFSAGSEMLHRNVNSLINENINNIRLFVTNNNILCCGEGICGSCIRKTNSGERIKTCKTLIDPKNIY